MKNIIGIALTTAFVCFVAALAFGILDAKKLAGLLTTNHTVPFLSGTLAMTEKTEDCPSAIAVNSCKTKNNRGQADENDDDSDDDY